MKIYQINKREIILEIEENNKIKQRYILISSEEGRALIKEYGLVIDSDMQEF